jgi:hypothetical protein
MCGYDKCPQALVFHHRDPSEKKFNISSNFCRSWKVIEAEVMKCDLLCCRCHTELHYEQDRSEIHKPEFDITNPEQKHNCVVCDKVFFSTSYTAKYCSVTCKGMGEPIKEIPTIDTSEYVTAKANKKMNCKLCDKEFTPSYRFSQYCSEACSAKDHRKVERPSKEQLQQDIDTMSWCAIGRKYGVSDNSVRKWARRYRLIE